MTDIVERLRCKGGAWINGLYDNEAADEIERLRSERDALREWLQWALDNCDDSAEWTFGTDATEQMRALLAECRIALMWPGEPAQEFLDRIDAAIAKESP